MNNKYLNEEQYQKANKKVKLVGLIILLVGLVLIGFGIFKIIQSNNMNVPKMTESNWFETSKSKNETNFAGIALIMFGVFISFIGCTVRFFIGNRREIMAYTAQQVMPVAQEGIETIAPSVGKAGAEIVKEMAPIYGEVAKKISKGIKEGINEANKDE